MSGNQEMSTQKKKKPNQRNFGRSGAHPPGLLLPSPVLGKRVDPGTSAACEQLQVILGHLPYRGWWRIGRDLHANHL